MGAVSARPAGSTGGVFIGPGCAAGAGATIATDPAAAGRPAVSAHAVGARTTCGAATCPTEAAGASGSAVAAVPGVTTVTAAGSVC